VVTATNLSIQETGGKHFVRLQSKTARVPKTRMAPR
jgi:hypothetical protein